MAANDDVVALLSEFAELYELLDIPWKPRAFSKAARQIEALQENISSIYKSGGRDALTAIEGIGEGISRVIEEYLTNGSVKELDVLRKKIPAGIHDIRRIPGVGPKKAMRLYHELHIDSLDKLETAAREGKIRSLGGFGEKSEQEILKNLGFARKGSERRPLGEALPLARSLALALRNIPGVSRVEIAGSVRRMKETCGDIDLLVISKDAARVNKEISGFPAVSDVVSQGPTRSTVRLNIGLTCDIRVVPPESFGAALQYFTGSKDHNVALRTIAVGKGIKLSEYGLFDAKKGRRIAGETEDGIYRKLGVPCVPPELRENLGELLLKKIPDIVGYDDLKGDLHTHTNWSDGLHSTEEMVNAAIATGYEYIAITDHSISERIQNGLSPERVKEHFREIDSLQKKYPGITLLKGAEVDILKDGSLDYDDALLKTMDGVIASVHSRFRMDRAEMTRRICTAMENPHVTAIGHLTGRLIGQRPGYDVDFEKICDAAARTDTALEVNANPLRLDINDVMVRYAVSHGVKLVIDTDAHATTQFSLREYGIAQARRGGATARDVVNCLPRKRFLAWLGRA